MLNANLIASKLTVLYGPSGVGKTSVLRAGVAQRMRALAGENLRERGVPELAVAIVHSWSGDAIVAVDRAVVGAVADALGDEEADLASGSLVERLGTAADAVGGELYLVLDQFEEYFLYHGGEAGEETLADAFPELVVRSDSGVNVLVCIREDALAQLDAFKAKVPGLFANSLRLDRLDRRAARDAIIGPIDAYNRLVAADERVQLEPALVDAVLDQVTVGRIDHGKAGRGTARGSADLRRIEAPYLQLVLQRVWDAECDAGSRELRLSTLEGLGGAERIVEQHLERALAGLSEREQEAAAAAFNHLVTPSGSKIAHRVGDLAGYAGLPSRDLQPVLSSLAADRIVRPIGDETTDEDRYEIYHDVLTDAVVAWRTGFEAARQLEQERRDASRRQRRLAVIAAVSMLALAAMSAVTVFALVQRGEAREQRAAADAQGAEARAQAERARVRELVARSASQLSTNPLESLTLAARAAALDGNEQVEDALRTALANSRQRAAFRGESAVRTTVFSRDGTRLAIGDADGRVRIGNRSGAIDRTLNVGAPVNALAFSRDGRLVVVAAGRALGVWRVGDGTRVRQLPHPSAVLVLAIARDGTLASGAADGKARVWRNALGPPTTTPSLGTAVRDLSFSRDGDRLVMVSSGGAAAVFNASSGGLILRLDGRGPVRAAAWSPGGRLVATGGPDGVVRVWNTFTGNLEFLLRGHVGRILDVTFSPRGSLIATASTDGTARVWNASRSGLVAVLVGHTNYVLSTAFSPDGRLVVTASTDRTARVWKVDAGNPLATLVGHRESVAGARFSPDGGAVLTWSIDGTTRLWDPETQPEARLRGRVRPGAVRAAIAADEGVVATLGRAGVGRVWRVGGVVPVLEQSDVAAVALGRGGSVVATGGTDGVASVWPLGASRPQELRHGRPLSAVAVDSRGELVVTSARDGSTRLWRIEGTLVRTLREGPESVVAAAFSEDARLVALGHQDGTARIVDVGTGQVLTELPGHRDAITSVAFSRDGGRVVTASVDHDARIWNVETGALEHVLRGHFAVVSDAAFSADGRWIVTAGPATAGVWHARTGRLLFLVRGHDGPLRAAAFTRDGTRIRTIGVDGTVRELRCDLCGRVDELRRLAQARIRRS